MRPRLLPGTSAATSISLLLDPAFVASSGSSTSAAHRSQQLFFVTPNCTALSAADRSALMRVGQAITNLTGYVVGCASLPPAWQPSSAAMGAAVFCGWAGSDCMAHGEERTPTPRAATAAHGPSQ